MSRLALLAALFLGAALSLGACTVPADPTIPEGFTLVPSTNVGTLRVLRETASGCLYRQQWRWVADGYGPLTNGTERWATIEIECNDVTTAQKGGVE